MNQKIINPDASSVLLKKMTNIQIRRTMLGIKQQGINKSESITMKEVKDYENLVKNLDKKLKNHF